MKPSPWNVSTRICRNVLSSGHVFHGISRSPFPGVKRSEPFLPFSFGIKNMWNCNSISAYVFMKQYNILYWLSDVCKFSCALVGRWTVQAARSLPSSRALDFSLLVMWCEIRTGVAFSSFLLFNSQFWSTFARCTPFSFLWGLPRSTCSHSRSLRQRVLIPYGVLDCSLSEALLR